MKHNLFRTAIIAVAIVGTALTAAAAGARKEDTAIVTKLVTAVAKADYDGFVGRDEPTLRRLTKEQFASVEALYGARLKRGYAITFLGELKQEGHRVSLWKIAFKDESDDALVTLSMKDGKVGGFFIR